jgi:hypothetical protein
MFDLGHYRGDLQSREITGNSQLAGAGPDPIFQLKAEGCVGAKRVAPSRSCHTTSPHLA